jgi:WD40 repeat protein/predicted Ser/Thr protein kinase
MEDIAGEESPGSVHLIFADELTTVASRELGDYELLEEIGHGGMGIIFKARQRSLDRIVAVKLIRSGSLARPGDVARFRTEAAAAARLQHPNIVAVYEVGEHTGQHFYSMEFVQGRSLAEALHQGPFSPEAASRLLMAVAEAIHFAHERGVLHRDLKPSNILLDREGQPRVADFGLAKLVHSDSEITLSGAVIGSPQYMPPEQASGRSSRAGASSDVYSMGAILYELLTGKPPFSAATPLETMKLVIDQEPVSPRSLNAVLPRDLETICLKCLAKNPTARFYTAHELAEELGRVLRNEPIVSRPVGPLERGWRWCRRKPALAGLGIALALLPIAIITVLLIMGAKVAGERNRLVQQEGITRQNLYAEDVELAGRALDEGDYGAAWRCLSAQIPSNSLKEASGDLRGFEWRWLWQKVQGDARQTYAAHLGPVCAIGYSPDGRYVASASMDGTVKIWDGEREGWLRTLEEPGLPPEMRRFSDREDDAKFVRMYAASFTADSRAILTGSSFKLTFWNLGTGLSQWSLQAHEVCIPQCSPADPGLALAYRTYPRTNLIFVDLKTATVHNFPTSGRTDMVCFSPDGRRIARWDRETKLVWIQTVPNGEVLGSFSAGRAYVITMAFTADGKLLALGNMMEAGVDLFDVAAQRQVGELPGHAGRLMALAFSPDGKLLAAGGTDQIIHLWDLPTRREIRQLHGHRSMVSALAFSPDSRRLVSGGLDGTVRFWDVAPPPPLKPLTNVFGAFALSPDGGQLVTQDTNGFVRLWRLPDECLLREWAAPTFQSAVFLPDGRLALAGCGMSNAAPYVCLLGPTRAAEQTSNEPPVSNIPVVVYPPDSTTISLRGIEARCLSIAIAPGGEIAVTGHQDGTIAYWNAQTGQLRQELKGALRSPTELPPKTLPVEGLQISEDGRVLGAASFTPVYLRLWGVPDGRPIAAGKAGIRYPLRFAISRDGQHVATGGTGQGPTASVWDASLKREMLLRGHLDLVNALAFAPDGRTLASGGVDGLLKLWHLPTQRDVTTLLRLNLNDQLNYLAFSRDGNWLGGADKNGVLYLFHAPPLEPVTTANR